MGAKLAGEALPSGATASSAFEDASAAARPVNASGAE